MYCPNCGCDNDDNAQFCRDCGKKLEPKTAKKEFYLEKNKIMIIALIAIVAILLVGVLYAGGVFKSNVPLETMDFEIFEMDVPVGAEFQEFSSMPSIGTVGGFIFLENVGDYSNEINMLDISTLQLHGVADEFKYERTDGNVEIYKDYTGQTNLYYAFIEVDQYDFGLMGNDIDTMIKMLNSVKIKDSDALSSQSSSSSSPQTTQSSSSSTPSSISILGGSFSTGSADADKTYARINVGTAHAGESVIVQIFYSRDGNSLNNGNMVPATVHSDGYLEIASADAYKYYPDYATINIYDSNSRLLTTQSVSLSPTSGTQTF